MEGHWPERENHPACLVHGLNPLLEALRGGFDAEATILIHPNLHTPNRCIANSGDKRFRLRSMCSDADCVRFVTNTLVTYVDVVIACGEIAARSKSQRDVLVAGCVVMERISACARVEVAGCIIDERPNPGGCVGVADGVSKQRLRTDSRVFAARCVFLERKKPGGCVGVAGGVCSERILTGGRVAAARC